MEEEWGRGEAISESPVILTQLAQLLSLQLKKKMLNELRF